MAGYARGWGWRALVAAALMQAGIGAAAPGAEASPSKPVIALANSYYGNAWRHQMVEAFEAAAEEAKRQGLVADYVVVNGDGSVNQQAAQLADLILRQDLDAIVINAASETALNGIVAKACRAGIAVISFDSLVSEPCAHRLGYDFAGYQARATRYVAERLGGKGNVMVVRGVKGSSPDSAMYEAQMKVLKEYPDIKVAATVYGQATEAVARSAVANVLPSMPAIDAVLCQGGGDDYGVVQAFAQFGGPYARRMPIVNGGNGSNFIRWWIDEHLTNGYDTVSMSSAPGVGAAAFWLAHEIVKGAKVPKDLTMPVAEVNAKNLMEYRDLPPGRIVSPTYDRAWVVENLVKPRD
jgi:ribose transport system substrate-binding protein